MFTFRWFVAIKSLVDLSWIITSFSSFGSWTVDSKAMQIGENGLASRIVRLRAGTPQGSCLSPLIYIISVNDLSTGDRQGTSWFQFADDVAVCGSGRSELEAIAKVQQAVLNVANGKSLL